MIKSFNEFKRINEAVKLPAEGKTFQPKTRKELDDIIKLAIKERGNEADLNFIDTSKITDMYMLFKDSDFNGDSSKWDVSNVLDMNGMFMDSKFNGKISNWDVSNVEIMSAMFAGCKFFGDLSKWDVGNVEEFREIFKNSPMKTKGKFHPEFDEEYEYED